MQLSFSIFHNLLHVHENMKILTYFFIILYIWDGSWVSDVRVRLTLLQQLRASSKICFLAFRILQVTHTMCTHHEGVATGMRARGKRPWTVPSRCWKVPVWVQTNVSIYATTSEALDIVIGDTSGRNTQPLRFWLKRSAWHDARWSGAPNSISDAQTALWGEGHCNLVKDRLASIVHIVQNIYFCGNSQGGTFKLRALYRPESATSMPLKLRVFCRNNDV